MTEKELNQRTKDIVASIKTFQKRQEKSGKAKI